MHAVGRFMTRMSCICETNLTNKYYETRIQLTFVSIVWSLKPCILKPYSKTYNQQMVFNKFVKILFVQKTNVSGEPT